MKQCKFCKSELLGGSKLRQYCDYKCAGKMRRTKIDTPTVKKTCDFCKVEFETKTARYCQDCRDASIWSYGRPALKRAEEVGIDWESWRNKTYKW